MDATSLIARIEGSVTALRGAVEGALEMATLLANNALPQRSPFAYVIPTGATAEAPRAATGLHVQAVTETYGVVLIVTASGDAGGAASAADVKTITDAIAAAVAGWQPAGGIAPFALVRARLLDLRAGTVFYQVDFSIETQLRNIPS